MFIQLFEITVQCILQFHDFWRHVQHL